MIIRKYLPKEKYTKIDNRVILDTTLSDGAKLLYCYLASLRNGQEYVDAYLIKALRISQRVLTSRKKELKDRDLILADRTGAKSYVLYIGFSGFPAGKVKEIWDRLDSNDEIN